MRAKQKCCRQFVLGNGEKLGGGHACGQIKDFMVAAEVGDFGRIPRRRNIMSACGDCFLTVGYRQYITDSQDQIREKFAADFQCFDGNGIINGELCGANACTAQRSQIGRDWTIVRRAKFDDESGFNDFSKCFHKNSTKQDCSFVYYNGFPIVCQGQTGEEKSFCKFQGTIAKNGILCYTYIVKICFIEKKKNRSVQAADPGSKRGINYGKHN